MPNFNFRKLKFTIIGGLYQFFLCFYIFIVNDAVYNSKTYAIRILDGAFKQITVISIFIPILVLGLPIFDNIFVLFKRLSEGRTIYIGDASQVHFRLLAKGFTQRQVVYLLYLASACLNLSAILLLLLKI
jgi:UDP-N-acetylmuramyl pentapeptide phosphotransferase/UDP-N-acetylglucosamine-1-phosphate transferase